MSPQQIAAHGRYGDNTLVHASNTEVQGLDALSHSIYGHELPRNPQTGLPEAFLFAPMLAPLLAGGMGGLGAIGTGVLAGGLGAAEAAARGMDDPLQQGLMAGLTGGAAAGVGNALSAAGQTAAQTAGQAAGQTAGQTAGNLLSTADIAARAAQPTTQAATQAAPAVFAPNPAMMAAETAKPGFMQGVTQTAQNIPQTFSDMGRGLKALTEPGAFAEGGVGQQFMKDVKMPLMAGTAGLAGQSALAQEQAMRAEEEERRKRGERDYNYSRDIIGDIAARNPSSMAGQAFYNPYMPKPYFAEGGVVNLFGGGALRDYNDLSEEKKAKLPPLFRNLASPLPNTLRPAAVTQPEREPVTDPSQLNDIYANQYQDKTGLYSTVPGSGMQDNLPVDPQQRSSDLRRRFIPSAQPDGLVFQNQVMPQFREALQYGAGNQLAGALTGYHNMPKVPQTDLSQFVQRGGPTGGSNAGPITNPGTLARNRALAATGANSVPEGLTDWQRARAEEDNYGYAAGGYLDGGAVPGDGMSDTQPAMIDGQQPAALSSGEFVVPADVVSGLGNGSSDAGAKQLYAMMDRIRQARTDTTEQAPQINAGELLPA